MVVSQILLSLQHNLKMLKPQHVFLCLLLALEAIEQVQCSPTNRTPSRIELGQQQTEIVQPAFLATDDNHNDTLDRFKRRLKASKLPEFSAPISNVTAVLGRDVRLICTVENLGQYQVSGLVFCTSP